MKVVEILGYELRAPMSRPARNALGTLRERSALLIEVVAEDGNSGWGEAPRAPAIVWAYIEGRLGGDVFGGQAGDVSSLWRSVAEARPRGEALLMAASALDIAQWDLRGRMEGKPVAAFLGPTVRDRVRAYASGPFMSLDTDPYRDAVTDAASYVEAGFSAVKLRAGVTPRLDAAIVERLRDELGVGVELMVDVSTAYSRAAARRLAQLCEPSDLAWLEEPLPPLDLHGYDELARWSGCPIAAGERLSELRDFREFLEKGVLSVIQPDLCRCGGFTGGIKIAALAEAYSTPVVPHVFGTSINLHASLQFIASLPGYRCSAVLHYPLFEYDRSDNPLRSLPGEPALSADSTVAIPAAPGLGIDIRRETFEPHVVRTWRLTND